MDQAKRFFIKVPEITIYFWIIKILTTAMGEVTSDFFVHTFNPIIPTLVTGVILLVALIWQFRTRRYTTWVYWFAVVMVSVFGTMAADGVHIVFGVPYTASTVFFAIVLAIVLLSWYLTEKTLSIHSIYNTRRELFYWVTVLTTFALGTAAGDWTASTLGLGYFASGVMFLVIFAIPALAYWFFKMHEVFAFWFAYIITRPLGASFADWLAVSHARGGLNLGDGLISGYLTIAIVCFVSYLAITKKDITQDKL